MKIHIITDTILPEEEVTTSLEFKAKQLYYISATSLVFDVLLIWFMLAARCSMIIIAIVLFFIILSMYYSYKVVATIDVVYDFYKINPAKVEEDVSVCFMNSRFRCREDAK